MKIVKNIHRLKIVEQIIIVSIFAVLVTMTVCGFVISNINQHSVRAQLCNIGVIVANSVSDSIDVFQKSIEYELVQISQNMEYFPSYSAKMRYLNKIKKNSTLYNEIKILPSEDAYNKLRMEESIHDDAVFGIKLKNGQYLAAIFDIENLKFNSDGLIPAIIIDDATKQVLMLAYMNKESLKISIERELTCFWSRSRKELWLKGETSGNYQHIISIKTDCDSDTLLISVKPDGPACHLGTVSCFDNNKNFYKKFDLNDLMKLIKGRKSEKVEGSYTSYLFEKGLDKILKKIGEESSEVIIAAKNSREETIYELADLIYHMLVLMAEKNIEVQDLIKELASRHVIDKKIKQEKMK